MAWFKVDDGFYSSLKFLSIERSMQTQAAGTWLLCGVWSADKMTDGFVPYAVMKMWEFDADVVTSLVAVGLWDHDEERGGIQFHDWCDYQPTKEQLEEKAEARHNRSVKAARARWSKDDAKAMLTNAKPMLTNAPEPEPEPTTSKDVVKRGTRIPPDFALDDDLMAWAKATKPKVDVFAQTATFKDYWEAMPGAKGVKLDWVATWRNWIRNSRDAVSNDADLAIATADRERRLAGHREFVDDIARARANAEPPPECQHGKSLVQCVPCAKELAGVA